MLESATTALDVLNWKVASFKSMDLPPIQPLTAWVLGVSIVLDSLPSSFASISPVSDLTDVSPAGNEVVIGVGHDRDIPGRFARLEPGKLLDRRHRDGQLALLHEGPDRGRVVGR